MWLLPQLLLVLSLAAVIQVEAQKLILYSTLPSNNQTCPGEKVAFTCVVQGPVLAWSSKEYIGSGGTRLEFGTIDTLMTNKTAANHSSTVATLLNISDSGGGTKMESQLAIFASAAHPTSYVICHDVSAGIFDRVDFNVIPKSSLPPQELLLNQSDCTLKLSWKMLEVADHYLVTIQSGSTIINITETSNMIRHGPLTADMIAISISTVSRCGQEGPSQTLLWSTDQSKCCNIDMEPTPCKFVTDQNPTDNVVHSGFNNTINSHNKNTYNTIVISEAVGALMAVICILLVTVIILTVYIISLKCKDPRCRSALSHLFATNSVHDRDQISDEEKV